MGSFLAQLEQSGLAVWIRESGVLYGYPLILFLHTLGLSTVVGLSSAIDLRLLGVAPGIPLEPLQKTFGLLWAGLALTALTGTLLFMSDAAKHAANPAFYVKLVFVALAVVALVIVRRRLAGGARYARLLAAASLGCWLVALGAGRLMAYISEFVS